MKISKKETNAANLLAKARSRMEDVVNGMESTSHLNEVIDEIKVYLKEGK